MEQSPSLEALFTICTTGFTLTDISDSPYIRVAEVLNILDNGIRDPLGLIFGHGFGGVYTDSTGLFRNVDVSIVVSLLRLSIQEYMELPTRFFRTLCCLMA